MSNFLPMVSVIVPTTINRVQYHDRIKKIFDSQDYNHKQLLFNWDESNIGSKRNKLCKEAIGDVLISFDDDDLYASDWISKSVDALIKSEADIVGISELLFYDVENSSWYIYTYPQNVKDWVAGASFAFWKEYWRKSPFPEVNIGEDNGFLRGTNITPKIFAHEYGNGFVATIHSDNTSKKILHNSRYRRCTVEEERELFETWKTYVTNPNP